MTDLRDGLVEAMRRTIDDWPEDEHGLDVGAVLDAGLGFLTDNAEAFGQARVKVSSEDFAGLVEGSSVAHLRLLIAALSDSRDTGEKP